MEDDLLLSEVDRLRLDLVERQGQRVNRRNLAIGQVVVRIVSDLEAKDAFQSVDAGLCVVAAMSALANAMATSFGMTYDDLVDVVSRSIHEQVDMPSQEVSRRAVLVMDALINRPGDLLPFRVAWFDPVERRRQVMDVGIVVIQPDRDGSDGILLNLSDEGLLALVGMLDAKENADVRFVDAAVRRAIDRGHYDEALSGLRRQRRELERMLWQLSKWSDMAIRGVELTWSDTFGGTITEILDDIGSSIERIAELGEQVQTLMDDEATVSDDVRSKLLLAKGTVDDLSRLYGRSGSRVKEAQRLFSKAILSRVGREAVRRDAADLIAAVLDPAMRLEPDEIRELSDRAMPWFMPARQPSHLDAGGFLEQLWSLVLDDMDAEGEAANGEDETDPVVDDREGDGAGAADLLRDLRIEMTLLDIVASLGDGFDMIRLQDACGSWPGVEEADRPFLRTLAHTWVPRSTEDRLERVPAGGAFSNDHLVGDNSMFRHPAPETRIEGDPR